jgi:putative tryptophan/tyrosine transport system substrate-binding protein
MAERRIFSAPCHVALRPSGGKPMFSLKRRKFIVLLGAAAAWPRVGRAQQSDVRVIGFLLAGFRDEDAITGFRQGLSESGYVDGRNVHIEYRYAEGNYDRTPNLIAELISLPAHLIVVSSFRAALAAKEMASTIPIVFHTALDPVKSGLVTSYNRPGGNITGMAINTDELTAKRVELLHELLPKSAGIAILVNPSNRLTGNIIRIAGEAAGAVGRKLIVVNAATDSEIESVFDALVEQKAGGVIVWQEPYLTSRRALIVGLAQRHAIPALYGLRLHTVIGGLMSYGPNQADMYRRVGLYAGEILNGAAPADLPVERPTKYELVINRRVAERLGPALGTRHARAG